MKRWRSLLPGKPGTLVLALMLAGLIGLVDAVTTYDFALSAFYLIPICWACWMAGRRAGLFLAVVCGIIWGAADFEQQHPYRYTALFYWNALMLLALFVAVVYSLSAFQDAHRKLLAARALLREQQ